MINKKQLFTNALSNCSSVKIVQWLLPQCRSPIKKVFASSCHKHIDITKTIPWYKYKTDKETKEKVKVLLDNKYDENWKKKLIEKESLANT